MEKYDAVVVGAGNAGLSAALRLAMSHKKTLLIEQNNTPGGCATSFVRGRFEFDPSLHELCSVGPEDDPGSVRKLFDEFDINIEWVKIPDCFRVVSTYSDGTPMDVTMPSGEQAFIDKMEEYVPGSRRSMEDLFSLFRDIKNGLFYISASKGKPDPEVLKKEHGNFLRTAAHPASKVLKALKLPAHARDILGTYWSYLGVDLDHLSFQHYASMVFDYVTKAAYIPRHTSHEISVKLLERFRELGGDVRMNCRANEFLFENGRITGVSTTDGVIHCDHILANINPDVIYEKMMPQELVPVREKKLSAARAQNYNGIMYTCYFGLDCTAESLGIHDYSVFFYGTMDTAKENASIRNGFSTDDFFIFLCYNVAIPDFSPEGTCVVSFTTFTSPKDWENVEPERYGAQKSRVASELLREFREKTGIDLVPHIEEMVTASPLTFARYLNTPKGSVYGYEASDWDSVLARMMSVSKDNSIPGLSPIGAAGPRADGYSMTYSVGNETALRVIKELEKTAEAEKNVESEAAQ